MPVEIKKTTEIIVQSRDYNSYGDLLFSDINGNKYKVGNKRVKYVEDSIIEGRLVKLNWAEAYGKDYIFNAELAELPDGQPQEPVSKPVQSKSEPLKEESNKLLQHAIKEGAVIDKPSGQEVGMTTKEIGDMIRADKLSVLFGAETAKKIAEWYMNRIKSTTGVN